MDLGIDFKALANYAMNSVLFAEIKANQRLQSNDKENLILLLQAGNANGVDTVTLISIMKDFFKLKKEKENGQNTFEN